MGTSCTSTVYAAELKGLAWPCRWYSTHHLQAFLRTNAPLYSPTTKLPSKPFGTPSTHPASTFWSRRYERLTRPVTEDGRCNFNGSRHTSECPVTKRPIKLQKRLSGVVQTQERPLNRDQNRIPCEYSQQPPSLPFAER
jgi:hypothetical protein